MYKDRNYLQQDNANVHTSHKTMAWLSNAISIFDWPAKSPDLNPIEHMWPALKEKLFQLSPNLYELTNNLENIRKFKECLQIAWEALSDELVERLLTSWPRRMQAVKDAKTFFTR